MVVFKSKGREFPGGPVLLTLHFHCKGPRFDPSWRTKVLQAEGHGQKKKNYFKSKGKCIGFLPNQNCEKLLFQKDTYFLMIDEYP